MVIRANHPEGDTFYNGLEIEIVKSLGEVMHFQPYFYESPNTDEERWGSKLRNGSYSGLIGQMVIRLIYSNTNQQHLSLMQFPELIFSSHSYRRLACVYGVQCRFGLQPTS